MLGWGLARESIRSAHAAALFRVYGLGLAKIHNTLAEPHRGFGYQISRAY